MTSTPYQPGDPYDPDERTEAVEARTDAAIRDLNARVVWPRPPAPASLGTPEQPPFIGTASEGNTHRTATPTRKVGIGTLGLIGGVLLALIVQDLLAVAFLRGGVIPMSLGIVLGVLMPVLAVLGAVIAVMMYEQSAKRTSKKTPDE